MPKTDEVLLARARSMRRDPTPFEQKLWLALRAKRSGGAKFSRQVVIGPYIADFAARSRKLVVEVDGDTHDVDSRHDERRRAFLEREGYRVIRFTNGEVGSNIEGVLAAISLALAALPLSQPAPGRPCPRHGLNSAGRCSPGAPQGGEG